MIEVSYQPRSSARIAIRCGCFVTLTEQARTRAIATKRALNDIATARLSNSPPHSLHPWPSHLPPHLSSGATTSTLARRRPPRRLPPRRRSPTCTFSTSRSAKWAKRGAGHFSPQQGIHPSKSVNYTHHALLRIHHASAHPTMLDAANCRPAAAAKEEDEGYHELPTGAMVTSPFEDPLSPGYGDRRAGKWLTRSKVRGKCQAH